MLQVTMMPTRPITILMTETLAAVAGHRMGQTVDLQARTIKLLIRRGLVAERNNRYCITQLGRETLGQRLSSPANLSTIKACRYWQSFYGLQVEVKYQDSNDWTQLEYRVSMAPADPIEFITRDFERRHLRLDCRPELVKPPYRDG